MCSASHFNSIFFFFPPSLFFFFLLFVTKSYYSEQIGQGRVQTSETLTVKVPGVYRRRQTFGCYQSSPCAPHQGTVTESSRTFWGRGLPESLGEESFPGPVLILRGRVSRGG